MQDGPELEKTHIRALTRVKTQVQMVVGPFSRTLTEPEFMMLLNRRINERLHHVQIRISVGPSHHVPTAVSSPQGQVARIAETCIATHKELSRTTMIITVETRIRMDISSLRDRATILVMGINIPHLRMISDRTTTRPLPEHSPRLRQG